MAVQSDSDRLAGANACMDEMSAMAVLCGTDKANLKLAYNALDQWVSDNAGAVNSAIPQPARAQLTTTAKAIIFRRVVTDRYLKGL